MLKIDVHIHSKEDKRDSFISYSAKQLIDKAKKLNFDVLALSFHEHLFWKKEVVDYAKKKGILLIPAAELNIKNNDVLVLNVTKKIVEETKTFEDLRKAKKKHDLFIIAPHPYFPGTDCLQSNLEKQIDLFDAIEYCWFHTKFINFNKKALKIAKKHNLPIIATSDAHFLSNFGPRYTLVNAKKNIPDIFKGLKKGKLKYQSPHISFLEMLYWTFRMFTSSWIKLK